MSRAGQSGSHTAVVIPIANEAALRQWNWVEANREYVERKSGGKVAYVYLPDTAGDGYTFFNRMFFAQVDKPAIIVDDRRNSGGQAANYVLGGPEPQVSFRDGRTVMPWCSTRRPAPSTDPKPC